MPLVRGLGRALQWLGLGLPVVAIVLQLGGVVTLGQMLVAAVAAVSAFYLGRVIEGFAVR